MKIKILRREWHDLNAGLHRSKPFIFSEKLVLIRNNCLVSWRKKLLVSIKSRYYCFRTGGQRTGLWAKPSSAYFCMAYRLKVVVTFLNGGTKIKRRIIFCATWKITWNSEIPGSRNKASLEHSSFIDVFVYGCFCPAVEVLSSCNRDHMWPRKLKTFTLWPFTEKVCHPCYSAVFIKMLISELLNK